MINYDYITKENIEAHNPNWTQILNHPYRILIIGGLGSGETNAVLNMIKQQDDDDYSVIDKIYLCVNDPNEAKYQYLIKKREKIGLEHCEKISEVFC